MAALYDIVYTALNVLILLAAGAAAVIALVMRKNYPKRATYAVIGFALFALATLTYLVSPLLAGTLDLDAIRLLYLVTNSFATILQIGAIGVLALALFRSEEAPRQPGQQQYGQPSAQGQQPYAQPQPQYQGQPPAQPMQQPQQQYGPPQQAPQPQYQQPPQGQPYPGQQPHPQQQPPQPPQQYPGSGY